MTKRARPKLDPEALLVFGAIASTGSVRAAAAAMGIPRSTISRRLAELEAQVGEPLAVRTSRRFALTELGGSLAKRCEELEDLMQRSEEIVRGAAREPSGTLRIAVAPVLGEEVMPEIVAELLRRHPRLVIHAQLGTEYVDLRSGAVDVALRAAGLEDASDLFALRLGMSVSGCYVSPKYAAARGVPATPADLAHHECIVVGDQARPRWSFRSGARTVEVAVSGRLRVDSFRVARDAAARDAGVLRVAEVFAEPLVASGALVAVLERYWPSVPVHAVHAGPNPPAPRVRAFLDVARAVVTRALPAAGARPRARWRSA